MAIGIAEAEGIVPRFVIGYITNPRETFVCELKPWINPETNDYDRVKIAKTCLALWNWDGGVLLLGFQDNGAYDPIPEDYSPEELFTQDSIQNIIGEYAAIPFGVDVYCVHLDGTRVIAVVVPQGRTTPLLCKKDSPAQLSPKLKEGILYTRSLGLNGTPGSGPATQSDLEVITKKCHDNRVADIGKFFSAHLTEENLQVLTKVIPQVTPNVVSENEADVEFNEFVAQSAEIVAAASTNNDGSE